MVDKVDNEKIMKELREKLLENKVIIGTERVLKKLKNGKIASILIANNCSESTKNDLQQYTKLNNTPLIELDINNEELGVFCKKNFFVSVLGIVKE